ncbi:MAG: efflux RND transporter periplasmic adaptor subunit [Nitrospinota bacterium]
MTPSRRNKLALALVLACVLGVASCKNETPQPAGRAGGRPRRGPVAVRVAPVKAGRLVYTIRATGTGVPETVVKLSARTEGQIFRVQAREGDRVKKGQVLVQVDDAVHRHQFELAKAEVQAARARLAKLQAGNRPEEIAGSAAEVAQAKALAARVRAEVESARAKKKEADTNALMYERMFRQGVVSPQQRLAAQTVAESSAANLSEMEAKLRESEAALNAARARLRLMKAGARREDVAAAKSELLRARENANLLGVRMEYARSAAPISGIVSERRVEPGDLARIGTHLLTLVNTERLKIRTQISELDLPKVKVGQRVEVTFDAYPANKLTGRVIRVFPTVDPASRQATVEVSLENPGGEIPSGLLARLTFTTRAERRTLIIPKSALVRRVQGGRYEVFVAKAVLKPAKPRAPGKTFAGPAPKAPPNGTNSRESGGKPARPATARSDGTLQAKKGDRRAAGDYIAESRRVVAGEIEGDLAEVRSGLSPGDLVVTQGTSRLRPGSPLRIVR